MCAMLFLYLFKNLDIIRIIALIFRNIVNSHIYD